MLRGDRTMIAKPFQDTATTTVEVQGIELGVRYRLAPFYRYSAIMRKFNGALAAGDGTSADVEAEAELMFNLVRWFFVGFEREDRKTDVYIAKDGQEEALKIEHEETELLGVRYEVLTDNTLTLLERFGFTDPIASAIIRALTPSVDVKKK